MRPRGGPVPALCALLGCLAGLALALLPCHATAQEETGESLEAVRLARIVARLVDARTGAPVTQALATLRGLDLRALSDSAGTVTFLDIPPGPHEVSVRHIGYGEQTFRVEVRSLTSVIMAVELTPVAVAVAPIEVQVEHRPRFLEDRGFYVRRAMGHGTFFDPQFVERWGVGVWAAARLFVALLLDMSPMIRAGQLGCLGDRPVVYIDGFRAGDYAPLPNRIDPLETLSTYTIGAVEIYPSSHGLPLFIQPQDAFCGAIAIWTNRWRGRTRELGGGDVELCEPRVPGAAVVEGTIRDEFTGTLLPGAHVLATSYPAGRVRAARTREIISNPGARYRVCDVPLDHTLTLKAVTMDRATAEREVTVDAPIVRHDISIRVAGPGDVVGRVVDRATRRPVATAEVVVRGTDARTRTDELGYFVIADVRPGDHVVEITHLGFEPVTETVSVVADRTMDLSVELSADPIALEPLVVTALRDRRLESQGYYERRTWGERTGQGTFLDGAAIERRAAARVTSLLADVPGLRVVCAGSRDCRVAPSRASGCEETSVYLNGTLAVGGGRRGSLSLDEIVLSAEVAAIEVYAGATSVPGEFSGGSGRCGAVALWTR